MPHPKTHKKGDILWLSHIMPCRPDRQCATIIYGINFLFAVGLVIVILPPGIDIHQAGHVPEHSGVKGLLCVDRRFPQVGGYRDRIVGCHEISYGHDYLSSLFLDAEATVFAASCAGFASSMFSNFADSCGGISS